MNTDDPKLTAFALGELDETERREVEALLKDDPAAAAEVAQLRDFSLKVRTVLAGETAPALGPVQRAELLATARGESPDAIPENEKPAPTLSRQRLWIPSAIAATVMVAAWYGFLHQPFDRFAQMRTANFEAPGGTVLDADSRRQLEESAPHPTGSSAPASSQTAEAKPQLEQLAEVSRRSPDVSVSRLKAKNGSEVSFSVPPAAPAIAANGPAVSQPMTGEFQRFPGRPATTSLGNVDLDAGTLDHSGLGRLATNGPGASAMSGAITSKGDVTLRIEGTVANPVPAPPAREMGASAAVLKNERIALLEAKDSTAKELTDSSKGRAPAPAGKVVTSERSSLTHPVAGNARTRDNVTRRELELQPEAPSQNHLAASKERVSSASPAPAAAPAEFQPPQIPLNFGDTSKTTALPVDPAQAPGAPPMAPVGGFNNPNLQLDVFGVYNSEGGYNTESYDAITDNPFLTAKENPLSTFSIDVDTASYANVRRFLTSGHLPPKGAVRIEELVNYFHYDYPQPKAGEPFSVNMEVAGCPWTPEHRLLRVGLKGREIPREQRPPANLVFLIDVSGSMMPANKLPLVKESLRLLVDQLGERDTVAIAVYAGASGTVLEPTHDKAAIREALGRLEAGGSTNGGAGLRLAYELAKRSFDKGKTNRVILATDGDFNVGTTSQSELVDLITSEAKSGVFLTVLGFGYGNLKDSTMEKLADQGNGNYAYIDTLAEGKKVLVEQMAGTLITIAKDVKIQIEFNPRQVSSYRLIGYENRLLAKEDFNNDKKDAGEIGAGHTVTALYELVPVNVKTPALTTVDPLKYQPKPAAQPATPLDPTGGRTFTLDANTYSGSTRITSDRDAIAATKEAALQSELLTLKLRWKAPDADTSTLREIPLTDEGLTYEKSSKDFRWAASVAGFGMILRDSQYKGAASWDTIKELAVEGRGEDTAGYRAEFLQLLEKAASLKR